MKSWKTTVVGALTAALVAITPILETGEINYKALGLAALIAVLSYLTKDKDVSGT